MSEPDFVTGERPDITIAQVCRQIDRGVDLWALEQAAAGGFVAGADELGAYRQLAQRQARALSEVRDLCETDCHSGVSRRVLAVLNREGL